MTDETAGHVFLGGFFATQLMLLIGLRKFLKKFGGDDRSNESSPSNTWGDNGDGNVRKETAPPPPTPPSSETDYETSDYEDPLIEALMRQGHESETMVH